MSEENGSNFLKGIAIGGAIAGIATLLMAPKSGRELREDMQNRYNNHFNRKQRKHNGKHKNNGYSLSNLFSWDEDGEYTQTISLLSGSAVGAVVGITAALLLAPKAGSELREDLGEAYDDIRDKAEHFIDTINEQGSHALEKVDDWKDTLLTLVDKLNGSKGRRKGSKAAEIAEWASLGLGLLQKLQKRR